MTRSIARRLGVAVLVASSGLAIAPHRARANGAFTHAHISQLAWGMLPPGPVRDLLSDPELQHACEAGSLFPDSGYAVSEPYGEHAHWEPFVIDYVADLRERYAGDYSSPEARREVAFLLGVASHGMADQTYDHTLLARAFEVDGGEPEGYSVDQYADYFIVIDEDIRFVVEAWAPYSALSPLLERSEGSPISEARLMEAMDLMEAATRAQTSPLIADNLYWDAWAYFPFLGTHVYHADVAGSLPWIAALVADYWQIVWRRLHASDDPDEDLVILTEPRDGRENWPVSLADSVSLGRIGVWFGYGIMRDEVTPHVRLRGPDGGEIPVGYRTPYGTSDCSYLMLEPTEPLDYATTYTIEVEAGTPTLAGRTSTRVFESSFRTRCDDAHLDDCPPLDPPLVTRPDIPMRPVRGGDAGPRDAGAVPDDAGSAQDSGDSRDADRSDAAIDEDASSPDPSARDRDDGCGCSAAGRRTPHGAWLLFLLGASLVAVQIRRARRRMRVLIVALVALGAMSAAADARALPPGVGRIVFDDHIERFGYVPMRSRSGTPLRWPGSCVFLRPHTAGTADIEGDLESTVLAAVVDHWTTSTRACGYLELHIEPAEPGEVALDYVNRIVFREDRWCTPATETEPELCHDPDAAALTTLLFVDIPGDPDDGLILDADIEVNAATYAVSICEGGRCTTASPLMARQDLANHLTHEIGHVVGLGHTCWVGTGAPPLDGEGAPVPMCSSPDLPFEALTATMFPFSELEETQKATLAASDIEGFCELYPLAADPHVCAPATPRDAGVDDAGAPADAGMPVDDAGRSSDAAPIPMDARRADAALRTVPIARDDGCASTPRSPTRFPLALGALALATVAALRLRRRSAG